MLEHRKDEDNELLEELVQGELSELSGLLSDE